MPPIANLIALVVIVALIAVFLGPRLLAFIASHKGTEAQARVNHTELTSVMDERKRYAHRLVLVVTPPGGVPEFEATVSQVLPFMAAGTELRQHPHSPVEPSRARPVETGRTGSRAPSPSRPVALPSRARLHA